jgi:hypothetical protein
MTRGDRRPRLLVLRSFSAGGHAQCFAAFLTFLPLCLTLPTPFLGLLLAAFASCFAFLATPMTDSSSPPDTPRSGGCHLPRWTQLKPGGGICPAAGVPGPDHQDHAEAKGDQPAAFEQAQPRGHADTAAEDAALDAGVALRDVQEAASHADPRTTMCYDRARTLPDRHATYIVAAYVARASR